MKQTEKEGEHVKETKELALCSMLAALGVVFLCIGGVISLGFYLCPILSSLTVLAAREECRKRNAFLCYIVISLLGAILCPDKECAFLFLFLGWYPLAQPRINRLPKILRILAKTGILAVSMTVMYSILFYVLGMTEFLTEWSAAALWLNLVTVILGAVLFFVYDHSLGILTTAYRRKRKK